jgi:polyketide synthase 12
MVPLATRHGLALFDTAVGTGEAVLLPVGLDMAALRARAVSGAVPALLRDLVRTQAPRPARDGGGAARLRRRLAGIPDTEREHVLLDLVRAEVAHVLGHPSAGAVEPLRAFTDLGFDSLSAVELRNRLQEATGLALSATLAFDQPNPAALARQLGAQLRPEAPDPTSSVFAHLDEVDAVLRALGADDHEARGRIATRIDALLGMAGQRPADDATAAGALQSATPDELFDFIDTELGS